MKTKTLDHMKTKQLENSDLFITPVGFGAWAIGGAGWEFAWGEQDDKASIAAIHRALELGVNWIDTAAVYAMGHSEEVVARALKTWPGKRPYVFTKCVLRWDERGQVRHVLSADSIQRECEDSLRRLREVGARHGRSPGQVAIAWTLRHPAVTGAIVGARSARQVEEIMAGADFPLTPREIVDIEGEQ